VFGLLVLTGFPIVYTIRFRYGRLAVFCYFAIWYLLSTEAFYNTFFYKTGAPDRISACMVVFDSEPNPSEGYVVASYLKHQRVSAAPLYLATDLPTNEKRKEMSDFFFGNEPFEIIQKASLVDKKYGDCQIYFKPADYCSVARYDQNIIPLAPVSDFGRFFPEFSYLVINSEAIDLCISRFFR
jgi:hypothetical protein